MTEARPGRLIAIGDIHGCAEELAHLLDDVDPSAEDELVFLGDYVDRGPASSAVIEILLQVKRDVPRTVFLRGNHEEMMLGFLGLDGARGEIFLPNGGTNTLRSYDVDEATLAQQDGLAIRELLPPEHVRFLTEDLSLSHVSRTYAFVHAGVRPGIPLEEQTRQDLLWIRDPFLREDPRLSRTVVFGHTPRRGVLFDAPRKIGIDTGLVFGGSLSALDLTTATLHDVEAGESRVRRRDVARPLRGGSG